MPDAVQTWTVKRLLEWTIGFFTRKNVDSPRLAAEILLAHVLNLKRINLYMNYERTVGEQQLAAYRELVRRAGEQEPVAYLTGKAHFFNLEFFVSPAVLIPRPDTEMLVENVLQLSRRTIGFETPRVLDLCTGSGCVAAAIAHHHKHATVFATELDPAAFEVAKKNIDALNLSNRITLLQGDLFEPLKNQVDRNPFDLIVANPPYIPTANIANLEPHVRDYEPRQALDGGLDGMAIHRRILNDAGKYLRSGGRIYLEIEFDQAELARSIAAEHDDFEQTNVLKDHAGQDRVLTVVRK